MPRFDGVLVETGGRFGGILVERAPPSMAGLGARRRPEARGLEPDTTLEAFGQNVAEVGKGIIPGAIQLGGTALKGVAGGKVASDRFEFEIVDTLRRAGSLTPEQIKDVRAKANRMLAPWRYTVFSADLLRALKGDDPEEAIKQHYPDTIGAEPPKVTESAIYQAGESVGKFGQELIPAAPGYEGSIGRQLGEGLGSMFGGAALSMVGGPLLAATAFSFAGSGEAVERAVQEGATEEQIIESSRLGVFPGMTDSVPVEVLTGRIPLPGGKLIKFAVGSLGPALKVIGRIGWQATVEGLQEGGQAWLQNLIAREVYKPEQSLTEGVLPEGGLGAGVGAIAETLATPLRRRGAGRITALEAPQPAPPVAEIEQPLDRTSAPEPLSPGPETQPPLAPTATAAGPGQVTPTSPESSQTRPQVITPEQVLEARTAPRFNGEPVGPRFQGYLVRETETVPTGPGRPAERAEPFVRPQAPVGPETTPAAPQASLEPVDFDPFAGEAAPIESQAAQEAPSGLIEGVPSTVYRGHGRTEQGKVYAGPAEPILGPGRYYAFTPEAAKEFGPETEQIEFAPKNPLVIRSDEEWRALVKEAGWKFPNPFGQDEAQVRQDTDRLQEIVRGRGHDAVVVTWDDATQTDTDSFGNTIKVLRNVFGQPQAFQFGQPAAQPAPEPPQAQESVSGTPTAPEVEKTPTAAPDESQGDEFGGALGTAQDFVRRKDGGRVTILSLQKRFDLTHQQARRLHGKLRSDGDLTLKGYAKTLRTTPRDVLAVIKGMGGVRPDGDLEALDLRIARPGLVVGRGKGGRSVSDIREHLEELQMLPPGSYDSEVYDLIRSALAKEPGRVTVPGDEDLGADQRARDIEDDNRVALEETSDEVRAFAKSIGEPYSTEKVQELAIEALESGRDVEDVVSDDAERTAIQAVESFSEEVQNDDYGDIPFLPAEIGQTEDDRSAVPRQPGPEAEPAVEGPGAAVDEGVVEDRGPPTDQEVAAEAAAKPTTEVTDQGEQNVLPGAERTTGKEIVEAQADQRIKGAKTQKPADEGLFDVAGRGQGDLVDLAKVAPAKPVAKPSKPASRIEDFGEVLEGARKHYAQSLADTLGDKDIDVTTEPLSKSFPQPNYKKLSEEGVSGKVLAYVAIMRDTIPNKPRRGWRVKQWAEQVETLRKFAQSLLDGSIDMAEVERRLRGNHTLRDLPLTAQAIEGIAPDDMTKAAQYRVSSGDYSMLNGKKYSPSKTFWFLQGPKRRTIRNPFSNDPAMSNTYRETAEETIELARQIVPHMIAQRDSGAASQERSKYTKVNVYTDRSSKQIFLGFKVRSTVLRLKSGFEGVPAAREYLEENRDEIQAKIDEMRVGPNMRGAENRPRSGASLREGDVTPEMFTDTFGFRGTQFGNYVEGKRRQADLNRAYDALMDLADVLDIPTQALSLNGSLGLAFGARGRGGRNAAAAHYEPGNIVINLTKGGGPGSLAHEFLHGLDSYFARQDDDASIRASGKDHDYMSSRRREAGLARDEVYQAWKEVEKTISSGPFAERSAEFDKARSKPYWNTTIEKVARAFERYVVDRLSEKGAINDYLANIDMTGGAYPTAEEMDGGIRAAYDKLFDTIEHRETDEGTIELHAGLNLEAAQKQWGKIADRALDYVADLGVLQKVGGYPFRDPFMTALGKQGKQQFLDMRGEAMGRAWRVEQLANHLGEVFDKATDVEAKKVFEYLTTKGADPRSIPDRPILIRQKGRVFKKQVIGLRRAAIAAKSTIKKLGQEMVRRGVISQESFDEHADAYLPRVYLKFLLERDAASGGAGLKIGEKGYVKQRIEDLPAEYRDLYLGEIKDPAFLVRRALSVPAWDMAMEDFLHDIAGNPEWVLPDSFVEWKPPGIRGTREVTPYWLKAEAQALRNRSRRVDSSDQAEAMRALAEEMDQLGEQGLGLFRDQVARPVAEEYEQLPDSPRYGDLRGAYVRRDIWNDIMGARQMIVGEETAIDKIGEASRAFTAFWKLAKVPLNVPTVARNFVSNMILMHIGGDVRNPPLRMAQALREIRHNGKHYRVALKHGVPASTFKHQELLDAQKDVLRLRGEARGGVLGWSYKVGAKVASRFEKAADFYQFLETWGKTAVIIDQMRRGVTEQEAVAKAQEALFDYSAVPNWLRQLRRHPFGTPFVTFFYKALPAVMRGAARHPGRAFLYYALPVILGEAIVKALQNVDDDDIEALLKALPEWMQDKGTLMVWPFQDEKGRWQIIDLSYFLPWGAHEQVVRSMGKIGSGELREGGLELTKDFGIFGGPIPQILVAVKTGMDTFTGRRIFEETDPPRVKAIKIMQYMWRLGAPTWLTDIGFTGHMYRSLTDQTNYRGDPPLTAMQAAARLIGVNIYPVNPEDTRDRNLSRYRWEIKKITRAMRNLGRDQSLSEDERDHRRDEYREMRDYLLERRDQYEKESRVHPRLRIGVQAASP